MAIVEGASKLPAGDPESASVPDFTLIDQTSSSTTFWRIGHTIRDRSPAGPVRKPQKSCPKRTRTRTLPVYRPPGTRPATARTPFGKSAKPREIRGWQNRPTLEGAIPVHGPGRTPIESLESGPKTGRVLYELGFRARSLCGETRVEARGGGTRKPFPHS